MKTWMYIFLALAFIACQKNDEMPGNPDGNTKTYTIPFKLGGELMDITQRPLSKSEVKTNKDLYWMEIWYSNKDKEQFAFYGRGVFDNPDSIKVEFKDGYKYRIQMAYVKNGKDKIWKDIVTGEYGSPIGNFDLGKGYYKCDNKFRITTSPDYFKTDHINVRIQDEGNNVHLSASELTGRYYGRIDNFIPEENSQINLDMYKASYGILVKVNNLTNGILDVYYHDGRDYKHFLFNTIDGKIQQKQCNELQWAWNIDNIATIMNNKTGNQLVLSQTRFYVKWTNGNSLVTLDLGSKDFWLERNKMNIITVNLSQLPSTNNGTSFTFETTPMTDKESGTIEGSIE